MTRAQDLEQVRRRGKRIRTGKLEIRAIASPSASPDVAAGVPRAGVIVPRYRHGTVERNLVKRRLRELLRQLVLPRVPPVDLVVRASPAAYGATFRELRDELERGVREIQRRHAAGALNVEPAPAPQKPKASS